MNAGCDRQQGMARELAQGYAALRADDVAGAHARFTALRVTSPDDPDVLHALACAALAAGRADHAIAFAGRALRVAPHGPFHEVLARALLVQGHADAARAAIRLACLRQPDDASLHLARAEIMEAAGAVAEAAQAFGQAVRLSGMNAGHARVLHARFLWRRGRRVAAIAQMRHVVAHMPHDASIIHELVEMLLAQDDRKGAEAVLRAGLAHDPADARALSVLGTLLFARGQMQAAADMLARAVAQAPDAESCNNLGLARMALGDMAGADAALRQAMRSAPDDARIALNHATGLFEGGAVIKACARYEAILARSPAPDDETRARARFNLGVGLLARGQMARGWALWESRLAFLPPHAAIARLPQWRGQALPLGRRLLVHMGQGLGDCVHFLRYVRPAARRVPIVLQVPAAMGRLAATLDDGGGYAIEIITHDGYEDPDIVAQCDLFSLPHLLHMHGVPAFAPYLGETSWRRHMRREGPLRVGLCHEGNAAYRFDARRSASVADIAPLGQVEGVEFISMRPRGADTRVVPFVRHELPPGADLLDTARLVTTLDLVISVDTLAAHLAGAMGCPVWLLSRFGGDWRWSAAFDAPHAGAMPIAGADGPPCHAPASQWYPTLRQFRQERPMPPARAWGQVVGRLCAALRAGQATGRA
ncbi:tetratricopeptide repeat protein [Komagataeibacter sp. FNDCF1]|uniref:tetratricopeptide repeat protein n=1 Tax=Komagataeibacter sp. FNDCF1 TaxID=2878681 RepID=UPI001E398B80|nr:tetratricopeptide repeat protein [Komagataeibacter sp. FNDCF1]MCE2565985.1 tetratricopeptide repeat protein [Komagataeibacter sp. FNDCF1]